MDGGLTARSTARRMASAVAPRMLRRLISRTEAAATPTAAAPLEDQRGQLVALPGREDLAVADPADAGALGGKSDGRSHHRTSQWAAADFIDTDQQGARQPRPPAPA